MSKREKKTKITQEICKKAFNYNPETGKSVWKVRDSWFVVNGLMTEWGIFVVNSNYANKEIGHIGNRGYLETTFLGETHYLHRLIWLWMTGEWPDTIDHINGDSSDNRWGNLRNVTQGTNSRNRKTPKTNSSGYCGVEKVSDTCFRARATYKGKTYNCGCWPTAELASHAYLIKIKELGFHKNHAREDVF